MKVCKSFAMALLLVPACSHKVLDAPLVSMTKRNLPKGAEIKSKGEIDAKYCAGEPAKKPVGSVIGLMDEATLRAQSVGGYDYIRNATFIVHNGFFKTCMEVRGEGIKVK
jgi:hypothetical protein